ncbi:hypothetical protein [Bacillus methanolicus]|uniref:hypothetical protein n=1 Tax=Bacillus methanolicus TaxID=1471 RepID=UPI00200C746A|nr:hypothetical protein [Bacillus methanolicus]
MYKAGIFTPDDIANENLDLSRFAEHPSVSYQDIMLTKQQAAIIQSLLDQFIKDK